MNLSRLIAVTAASAIAFSSLGGCSGKNKKKTPPVPVIEVEPTAEPTTEPIPAETIPQEPVTYPEI